LVGGMIFTIFHRYSSENLKQRERCFPSVYGTVDFRATTHLDIPLEYSVLDTGLGKNRAYSVLCLGYGDVWVSCLVDVPRHRNTPLSSSSG